MSRIEPNLPSLSLAVLNHHIYLRSKLPSPEERAQLQGVYVVNNFLINPVIINVKFCTVRSHLYVFHTLHLGKFIIHAQTKKCTLYDLFSHTYFVFYSLHLHVSVTPVTIFRVLHNIKTRSRTEFYVFYVIFPVLLVFILCNTLKMLTGLTEICRC